MTAPRAASLLLLLAFSAGACGGEVGGPDASAPAPRVAPGGGGAVPDVAAPPAAGPAPVVAPAPARSPTSVVVPAAAPAPASAASPAPSDLPGEWIVGAVPPALRERLGLSAFYERHLDAGGVPVLASGRVREDALREARSLVLAMVGHRPDLRAAMADAGVRVVVMAPTEFTTDVPEHASLRPAAYWDGRARGLGATSARPAVSCGEENLLGYRGDPYATESILLHEFAHTVHLVGLAVVDPTFDGRLRAAFDGAAAEGRWEGTYASKDLGEYWAEGVQGWFDANTENDGQHNHVDTRAELRAFDPALARLCEEVFGDGTWRWSPPRERHPPSPHLTSPRPARERVFSWSDRDAPWRTRATDDGEVAERKGVLLAADARPDWSSTGGRTPAVLVFANGTSHPLDVAWMDYDGKALPWIRVVAGEARPVETFVGHVFRVATREGEVLGYSVADAGTTTVPLSGAGVAREAVAGAAAGDDGRAGEQPGR